MITVAICGMKCVNLKESTVKFLGIKKKENEENFKKRMIKTDRALKL